MEKKPNFRGQHRIKTKNHARSYFDYYYCGDCGDATEGGGGEAADTCRNCSDDDHRASSSSSMAVYLLWFHKFLGSWGISRVLHSMWNEIGPKLINLQAAEWDTGGGGWAWSIVVVVVESH